MTDTVDCSDQTLLSFPQAARPTAVGVLELSPLGQLPLGSTVDPDDRLTRSPEGQAVDHYWMQQALQLAQQAKIVGEVPVGALLLYQGQVIGRGYNQSISQHDPSAHAEIVALRQAGQALGNYRLLQTTLYVTLEPCCMCVGALIHSRIARLVYGAADPKTGAVDSCYPLLNQPQHNHRIVVTAGVLQEDCATQLTAFFRQRRNPPKIN